MKNVKINKRRFVCKNCTSFLLLQDKALFSLSSIVRNSINLQLLSNNNLFVAYIYLQPHIVRDYDINYYVSRIVSCFNYKLLQNKSSLVRYNREKLIRLSTCFLKSIVQHKNCNDSNEYLFDAQIRFSMYCAVNDYAVLKRVERAEVRHI